MAMPIKTGVDLPQQMCINVYSQCRLNLKLMTIKHGGSLHGPTFKFNSEFVLNKLKREDEIETADEEAS